MVKKMVKPGLLVALALVAVPAGVQAEAARAETYAIDISYKDLDLTRADHQARLDRRIAEAVTKVCGRISPRTLSLNNAILACRAEALHAAQGGARVAIAHANQRRAFASSATPMVGN